MVKLAKKNLNKLKELAFENNNVNYIPHSVVLGRSDISKNDAVIIDNELNKMIDKGEIKKSEKEKGVALLAELYLRSQKQFQLLFSFTKKFACSEICLVPKGGGLAVK